jgi:hypothetical protein
MRLSKGDTVYLTQDKMGYRFVARDPAFAQAMKMYQRVARRYRNALRELSK